MPFTPRGITIHYTAGGTAHSSMDYLRKETQLRYHFVIDRDGSIYQMVNLDSSVSHAGSSRWNCKSVNKSHVAIAIASYGFLTIQDGKFFTAYNQEIDKSRVVYRQEGHWEGATYQQELALERICRFLMRNFMIYADDICGHAEADPRRKIDPGGILSYTMSEFRERMDQGST